MKHKKHNVSIEKAVVDVGNLGAILSWRVSKGIYVFDETLLENLWNTPLDGDLPTDLFFRLPEWCCYIDLSYFDKCPLMGFFVFLEEDANNDTIELRFSKKKVSWPGLKRL